MNRRSGRTDGFEEAFDELFRRAFVVARRVLGDPASAEDVAAEALARAYAHWPKIGAQPWREGWVVRVTGNLAIDVARQRSHISDQPIVGQAGEDDDVAVRLALVAALGRLPKRQREVVTMRHLAGMSEAECAAALAVSTGTVKTHLHRGVASLRAQLGSDSGLGEVTADV